MGTDIKAYMERIRDLHAQYVAGEVSFEMYRAEFKRLKAEVII